MSGPSGSLPRPSSTVILLREESAAAPLGSRLRGRFARIGLHEDIAEFRGQKARAAVFKR